MLTSEQLADIRVLYTSWNPADARGWIRSYYGPLANHSPGFRYEEGSGFTVGDSQ